MKSEHSERTQDLAGEPAGGGRAASELLALLDGLSTRVVLGQRGADRANVLRMALSATERLVERG
ncbi:hypothetical protein OG978_38920 [Streptomyces sp. NBC_01591]|uniref:hypothetical protein n=1 Tax=Streptomyces sp. NBC_01591 TaxID=2975888 RepID=UPI002DD90AA1|nr:hypothetical protein [Streptomyces sp. NBC_01591]WSD72828.1 hypothetical protein OG978_38920 [Streptomyces sp. NBC_01591]